MCFAIVIAFLPSIFFVVFLLQWKFKKLSLRPTNILLLFSQKYMLCWFTKKSVTEKKISHSLLAYWLHYKYSHHL